MRIAQIAPLKCHGDTERVIHWLADELVALGHDITLYKNCSSAVSAGFEAAPPLAPHASCSDKHAPPVALGQGAPHSGQYDFLHFHSSNHPFCLSSPQGTPFVTTLHGRLDLPHHQLAFDRFCHPPAVSVSDAQRRSVPQANWVKTIYYGVPQRLLTPVPVEPRYFAFLGRIGPETGIDLAISIARECGVPIRIAAKIDKQNCEYFEKMIVPLLDGSRAVYIGEVTEAEKSEFLSGAVALLDPADSSELPGLPIIEAMACGTPVVAFNCGPAPDIVDDGWTGFIVDDEKDAMEAFDQLPRLSREYIRSQFEQRFTARQVALEYLDVYRSLMDHGIYCRHPAVNGPKLRRGEEGPDQPTAPTKRLRARASASGEKGAAKAGAHVHRARSHESISDPSPGLTSRATVRKNEFRRVISARWPQRRRGLQVTEQRPRRSSS
jgi:glycosyltransferase involved in cell wall biosynthesis